MIVLEGQTIVDISIQEFGSAEFVAKICQDNDVGIAQDLAGMDLVINSTGLGNQKVKDYIRLNNIKPNNKSDYITLLITSEEDLFMLSTGDYLEL